jgi:hypothetical protein|tara:strand:+ start:259 stop:489 length:231 start_codon:yes stop_codon:yes gene_type:complete
MTKYIYTGEFVQLRSPNADSPMKTVKGGEVVELNYVLPSGVRWDLQPYVEPEKAPEVAPTTTVAPKKVAKRGKKSK